MERIEVGNDVARGHLLPFTNKHQLPIGFLQQFYHLSADASAREFQRCNSPMIGRTTSMRCSELERGGENKRTKSKRGCLLFLVNEQPCRYIAIIDNIDNEYSVSTPAWIIPSWRTGKCKLYFLLQRAASSSGLAKDS